jgi:hypothetical protein
MTTTATRPAELRRMAASVRPSSVNENDRTVSSGDRHRCTDRRNLSLVCTREAVQFGPAPVPVLLSHSNHTDQMAGRITQLRFERGQVIGTAQFTDAPAADQGWQLARAGCAVSVGARIDPAALRPQSEKPIRPPAGACSRRRLCPWVQTREPSHVHSIKPRRAP